MLENISETIISKIEKLRELAEQGYKGEAKNAKLFLEKYLNKYGITLEDLDNKKRKVNEYKFKYSSKFEKLLLFQCIVKIFGSKSEIWKNGYRYKNGRMEFIFEMTEFEYILLKDYYEFHTKEFKKQLKLQEELFFSAYLEKHKIYNKDKDENIKKSSSNYSLSELITIFSMVDNLNKNGQIYYKAIEK